MARKRERKFWIGVGSGDHVEEAVQRSFCLLSHSTEVALAAMHPGDGLVMFVKRPTDHASELVERFEAIGVIGPGTAWTRGRHDKTCARPTVVEAMDLPGFAWEVRHDRGLDFAVAAEGQDAPGASPSDRGRGLADPRSGEGPFRMRGRR